MTVTLIAAVARNGVIGADGGIPWHLPEDSPTSRRPRGPHPGHGPRDVRVDRPAAARPHHDRGHPRPGLVRRRRAGRALARGGAGAGRRATCIVAGGATVYAAALPLRRRAGAQRGRPRAGGRHVLPAQVDPDDWAEVVARAPRGVRRRDAGSGWQAEPHGAPGLHRTPAGRDVRRPAPRSRRRPSSSGSARSSAPTTTSRWAATGSPGRATRG